jgi:hypothetical protein
MEGKVLALVDSHINPLQRMIEALEQKYVFLGLSATCQTQPAGFDLGSRFKEPSMLQLVCHFLLSSIA